MTAAHGGSFLGLVRDSSLLLCVREHVRELVGWRTWFSHVVSYVHTQVADAQVTDLDCWRLRLTLPDATYKPHKTYALSEVPMQQQQQTKDAPAAAGDGVLLEGLFWNYFSVGADAQAAYNFHHLRDTHPALASNRVANQFWYSAFSCTSGEQGNSGLQA